MPAQDALTWCIGPPLRASFVQLLDDARADEAVRLYRERFASEGLFENFPYPGIHQALDALAGEHRLYVASSKPIVYVDRIVEAFDLQRFFQGVYGSELDGTRADKTELLAYALADTGLAGESAGATMIGDREHDIRGGLNNKLTTVGVLYGYGSEQELRDAGAHRLVDSVAALRDF